MAADQATRVAVENELHQTVAVTDDLAAEVGSVAGAPDDRPHAAGDRIGLRVADARHLGDRVDAVRDQGTHLLLVREAERVADRDAALLHGTRGERRKTDAVARGVDVSDAGAE